MRYLIFAVAIVSVQSNTIGRGWGSQPPAQNVDIVADGNVQIDASGSSSSYTAADTIVVGDAAQPATLFLATSDSAQVFEDGSVSQIEVADASGDTYMSNIVLGIDEAVGAQGTAFFGSGTGVAVNNVGGTDSFGTGQISGYGGPVIQTLYGRPPIEATGPESAPLITPDAKP